MNQSHVEFALAHDWVEMAEIRDGKLVVSYNEMVSYDGYVSYVTCEAVYSSLRQFKEFAGY
jgi:hypothetical protein